MQIEEVRIDSISLHGSNPKIHPENQIRLIEKSIKKFGYTNPVILSAENIVLAGHARIKAAIAMGQDTIPAIRTKLTGKEADAYLIADNRIAEISQYDRDILAELLSDLPKDLAEITGFDQVQVDALLSGEDIPDIDKFISDSQPEEPREEVDAEPQIDRAAELNKTWQVKPGDLWQCGEHRLICGDCTDPAVVERVMMGEKADLVLTDPPYNVGKDFENDNLNDEEYLKFIKSAIGASINALLNNATLMVWCCEKELFTINRVLSSVSTFRRLIVWVYTGGISLETNYSKQCEFLFYNTLSESDFIFNTDEIRIESERMRRGDKRCGEDGKVPPNWLEVPRLFGNFKERVDHPTQKPLGVITPFIKGHSLNYVLDPFLGSGTTMIACENTGRKCRGIEISPAYVAVRLQRFKDATGKEPVRING